MSEPNNTFPFPGMETGGTPDISAIFGSNTPGDDVNPFEMPAASGPIEMTTSSQEPAPAAEPEPTPEPEPAAEPGPVPEPAPAEEPNLISAAFAKQEKKNTQQGLLEKPPVLNCSSKSGQ